MREPPTKRGRSGRVYWSDNRKLWVQPRWCNNKEKRELGISVFQLPQRCQFGIVYLTAAVQQQGRVGIGRPSWKSPIQQWWATRSQTQRMALDVFCVRWARLRFGVADGPVAFHSRMAARTETCFIQRCPNFKLWGSLQHPPLQAPSLGGNYHRHPH